MVSPPETQTQYEMPRLTFTYLSAVCRKRHMKCDEAKPVCGPCARGNRTCVYASLPLRPRPNGRMSTNDRENSLGSDQTSPDVAASPVQEGPATTRISFTVDPNRRRSSTKHWPSTSTDDSLPVLSPQSNLATSTGYGTEVAPLRWFGLLADDVGHGPLDLPGPGTILGDDGHALNYDVHQDRRRYSQTHEGMTESIAFQDPSKLLHISAISQLPLNGSGTDERHFWQTREPIQLKDHEFDVFHRFVTGISLWIDLFDPGKHFSTLVPHLALHNEGLMKAVLALGARHLSIKPLNSGEASIDRTAAVQYYFETIQYLQSAMRFTSYKNSQELLATVLVVSMYEMIDGAGQDWERHLKGVFWIQRSREINGESGGLEQAVWWAWLRQDVWAAFREHRRCFSFFKPTIPYHAMGTWDMASRVVYILAQAVNYSSDEEKQSGQADLTSRIFRANTLLNMLDEWRSSISVHFEPLPVEGPSNRAFPALWVHPPAFGVSLQMYSVARILLLSHQPVTGGYMEYPGRDRIIADCVDTIGGVALKLCEDASRLMSTQCLFAAGLFCKDEGKRGCVVELIQDHQRHTGWPVNMDLAQELREEWAKQKPR